jgi:hypothetical protein
MTRKNFPTAKKLALELRHKVNYRCSAEFYLDETSVNENHSNKQFW